MKTLPIMSLSYDGLQNLRKDVDVIERVENNWPIINPEDFESVVKFEGQFYSFDETKRFLFENED